MRLQYFGHSCFRLISDTGTTVVCDPFDENMVGLTMPHTRTDVVTVSHNHNDHNCVTNIVGSYALLDGKVTCACDDIAIDTVETWHDEVKGAKRGANLVFTFGVDGMRVAHLGDIGFVDPAVVKALCGYDVIMLPVGGVYTVDAEAAAELVRDIAPKIVLPMHYMTAQHKFRLDGLDKFLTLAKQNGWNVIDNGAETLRLDDVPTNVNTEVVVLKRFED